MRQFSDHRSRILAISMLIAGSEAFAQDWRGAGSPFTLGEAYPETPATCETIGDWIDRAPDTLDRVSLAISGKLVAAQWDGALAYLVMCKEPGVQVMCVTYSLNGRKPGDQVMFAGGYSRVGERRIMLDPCLASLELNSPSGGVPGGCNNIETLLKKAGMALANIVRMNTYVTDVDAFLGAC